MKVIYETIERTVSKAINEAANNNRRIERIELKWWEASELKEALSKTMYIQELQTRYSPKDAGSHIGKYMGVDLYIEKT